MTSPPWGPMAKRPGCDCKTETATKSSTLKQSNQGCTCHVILGKWTCHSDHYRNGPARHNSPASTLGLGPLGGYPTTSTAGSGHCYAACGVKASTRGPTRPKHPEWNRIQSWRHQSRPFPSSRRLKEDPELKEDTKTNMVGIVLHRTLRQMLLSLVGKHKGSGRHKGRTVDPPSSCCRVTKGLLSCGSTNLRASPGLSAAHRTRAPFPTALTMRTRSCSAPAGGGCPW